MTLDVTSARAVQWIVSSYVFQYILELDFTLLLNTYYLICFTLPDREMRGGIMGIRKDGLQESFGSLINIRLAKCLCIASDKIIYRTLIIISDLYIYMNLTFY